MTYRRRIKSLEGLSPVEPGIGAESHEHRHRPVADPARVRLVPARLRQVYLDRPLGRRQTPRGRPARRRPPGTRPAGHPDGDAPTVAVPGLADTLGRRRL